MKKVQLTLLLDWISGQSISEAVAHLKDTYGVEATATWRNAPFVYVDIEADEATLKNVQKCHFVYGVRDKK